MALREGRESVKGWPRLRSAPDFVGDFVRIKLRQSSSNSSLQDSDRRRGPSRAPPCSSFGDGTSFKCC